MANLGSLVLSGGISLGVFTGFLFVLLSGLKWASQIWRALQKGQVEKERRHCTQCIRCGEDVIHQTDRGGGIDNCYSCSSPVCSVCCIQDPQGWLCSWCIKERERNLNEKDSIFSVFRGRFQSIVAPNRSSPKYEGAVRDFVEKLTEGFLGGSLDHVRINRLTGHPSYMGFMEKYEGVLSLTLSRMTTAVQVLLDRPQSESKDDPTLIEIQLKHLIKEIIQEALQLPSFHEYSEKIQNNIEDLSTKTYEDILATAILNKVVENFNFEVKEKAIIQSAALLKQLGNEDSEWPLATGENEIHDRIRKISAINDSDHFKLNNGFSGLTLHSGNKKAIFPEFGVDILNDLDVEDTHTEKTVSVDYWEENWLFQKKDIEETPPAVPMLVPSPKDDICPTIGEINVNDLSELSDCSDSEIEMVVHSGIEFKTSNKDPKGHHSSLPENESLLQDWGNVTTLVEARNFEIEQSFQTGYPAVINTESQPNMERERQVNESISHSSCSDVPIISVTEEKSDLKVQEEEEEVTVQSYPVEDQVSTRPSSPTEDEFPTQSSTPVEKQIFMTSPKEDSSKWDNEKQVHNPEERSEDSENQNPTQCELKWETPSITSVDTHKLEKQKDSLDNCAGPDSLTFERDSEYVEEYASVPQMENHPNIREDANNLQRSASLVQLSNGLHTMKSLKKSQYSIESELEDYLPSVKQLAKHFSKNGDNVKRTHVHSLTARNTARESQKMTRCSSEKTLPITNIHNNIEFWERMASKHTDADSNKNKGLD